MKLTAPFLFTLIATSVAPVFAAPVPLQIEGRKFNPKDIHNTGHTSLNKRWKLPPGLLRKLGAVGIAGAVGSAVYVLVSKPLKDILGLNKDEDAEAAAAAAGSDDANGGSPIPLGRRGLTQVKWSDLTHTQKQTWANTVADAILNASNTHFDASKLGMSQKEVKEIVARLAGHPSPRDALASELIKTLDAASTTEVSISKRTGGIAGAFATAFKSIGKGGILKELGIGLAGGAALVGAFGLLSKLMGGSKDTEAAAVPVPSDDENVVSKRSPREKRLAVSSITSLIKGFGKFMTTPVTKAITNDAGEIIKAAGKTPLVTTMIAAIGSAAMAVGGLTVVEAFKNTKYKDIFSASTVKRDTGLESEHVIAKRINLKLGGVLGMAATGVVAIGSTLGAAWGVGKLYDVGKSFFLHKKPATVEAVPEDYTPVPENSYENLD